MIETWLNTNLHINNQVIDTGSGEPLVLLHINIDHIDIRVPKTMKLQERRQKDNNTSIQMCSNKKNIFHTVKNSERYYCIVEIFGYFDLINDNGMCEFKETLGIFPALTFMPVSYVSPVLIKNIEVLILQLKILYVLSETSSNKTYCYYTRRDRTETAPTTWTTCETL